MYKKIYFKSLLLLAMLLLGAGNLWADETPISFDLSTGTNGTAVPSVTSDPVTITFSKGTGSNAPTYYTNGAALRFYSGNTITIASSGPKITKVEITNTEAQLVGGTDGANFPEDGEYSVSNKVETWVANSPVQSLTINITNKPRVTGIVVYVDGAVTPTCSTPTFDPEAGSVVKGTLVSISTTPADATIYYTTDGSDPTENSNVYSDPIEITEATTIKAYAVKADYEDSEVATAEYTIKQAVTGYDIDFESDIDAYVDWEFTNVGNTNTAITAHGGDKYGSNLSAGGSGTASASIQTKETIALPGNLTCYVSKVSTNSTASTWTISVSTDGETWTEIDTHSASGMNKEEWQEFTADLSSYSDVYVRISYAGSTAIRAIDDISLTMREDNGKMNPDLSFPESAYEVDINESFEAPNLINVYELPVTYSSSDESVATVDNSGSVSILAAGTTTITASFAGNDEYNEGSASYTLTVVDPNAPGTENNPYTVAQARDAIDAGTGVTGVFAKGIVSKIVTAFNPQFGNISYNISEDGTEEADQLEAYRGFSYDGEWFTSEDDIQVGDEVVIYGNLTKYGNTYEFAASNQLVSLVRTEESQDPVITLVPSTINVDAEEHNGTIAINLKNLTVEDKTEFGVQYWNGNEPVEEIDWITVEIAEQDPQEGEGYVVSYTVAANDGPTRTAAFKLYVEGDEDDVWSDLVTITQAAYVAPPTVVEYALVSDASKLEAGKKILFVAEGDDAYYAMGGQNNNNRAAVAVTLENDRIIPGEGVEQITLVANDDETWSFLTADGYLYAASNSSNHLKSQDEINSNAQATIEIDEDSKATILFQREGRNDLRFNPNNGNPIFSCYASSSNLSKVYIYMETSEEVIPETVTAEVSAAGLATFCSEWALDFTGIEEVYAYKVSVNEKQISYTRVYQVPAETGVVLRSLSGDAISVEVPVIESADEIADNALVAVLEAIESLPTDGDGYTNYILNNLPSKGVGFYKANNQPVGAGKAYLQVEGTLSKDFIGFADGVATGIETIDNGWTVDNEIYDLQGRKVMNPTKGIFIQNGRKVVIK